MFSFSDVYVDWLVRVPLLMFTIKGGNVDTIHAGYTKYKCEEPDKLSSNNKNEKLSFLNWVPVG